MSNHIEQLINGLSEEYKNSKIYLFIDIFIENMNAFQNKIIRTFQDTKEIIDFFVSIHEFYLKNSKYPDYLFFCDLYRSVLIISDEARNDARYLLFLEATEKLNSHIIFV